MDKHRPNFADDLAAIREDVTTDVGTILQLAKTSTKTSEVKPAAEPVAPSPVHDELPRRVKKPSRPSPVAASLKSRTLENVTTRLSQETNELLTEVALRRKLKKQTPDTRQSVIEVALREYFERHGYAKPSNASDEVIDD